MEFLKKLAERNCCAGEHRPLLIAFLGASLTHGGFEVFINHRGEVETCIDAQKGYVGQLQRKLQYLYPAGAVNVLNAGVSGETASKGLKRLQRDVLDRKPDLVVVDFALNDCMDGLEELPRYKESLKKIFCRIKEAGCECIFLTPMRMCSYVSSYIQEPELRAIAEKAAARQNEGVADQFVEAGRRIAEEQSVPIADANAYWNLMEKNGVDTTALLCNHINHPDSEAHSIFVEVIMGQLLAE